MHSWVLDRWYVWRVLSAMAALCLMQLPLPYALNQWQPQWVLMVCFFWLWTHPSRFSMVWVVLVAFITDYVSGLPLGVHAMSFIVLAGVVIWKHNQLMHFDLLHQFFFSMILILCYLMLMRISFELCQLEWSWIVMLKTQISTCLLWTFCIWRFNFHEFWFYYVG